MVIVWQTTHGAYILAEMDGTISKLRFSTFCIIPYHARWRMNIDLDVRGTPLIHSLTFYSLSIFFLSPLPLSLLVVLVLTVTIMVTVT
jgi:hypothetical protein